MTTSTHLHAPRRTTTTNPKCRIDLFYDEVLKLSPSAISPLGNEHRPTNYLRLFPSTNAIFGCHFDDLLNSFGKK